MKKAILVLLVGLFWCNPGFAKEIWLKCTWFPGEGRSGFAHSFIIDDIKKTVIHNGKEVSVIKFNEHIIVIETYGAKYVRTLDRITGYYEKRYKCIVVKKHSF